MRPSGPGLYLKQIMSGVLLLAVLGVGCVACASGTQSNLSPQIVKEKLPGQQTWKQGVSSFLFGTNDTYEWSAQNIQTQPAIQRQIHDAGFTLIRSFFPDNAGDGVIEQRMHTIENSGAHCLGVITNIFNTQFDEHLVRYLGNRCQLYEFGNEPDYNGISINAYLNQWNTLIPMLRQINPDARFIGPVTYNAQGNNGFMKAFLIGVKASGVLPDAVSFHMYPCYQDSRESCLARADTYAQAAQDVRSLVKNTLGKDLPVGITEWNYDPSNPPPSYGDDSGFITQFTRTALQSMMQGGVAFACQFDAASYSGYGRLDMFDANTAQAKSQYYAIKGMIQEYRPSPVGMQPTPSSTPPASTNGANGLLVSRGKPVYCSTNNVGPGGTQAIVDGRYGNWAFWNAALSSLPSWCAIHVGAGPKRLLLTWTSDYVFDYMGDSGLGPQDYTLSVSANSTNGVDGTWRTVTNVTGNHTRVREHLLPFEGQSWVKMTVTKGQPKAYQPYIFIDEVGLYDVSAGLNDTFFFSGDSITAMAYSRSDDHQPSFAENVHAAFPDKFPAMLDGGMGGWNSGGAVQSMDLWLSLNPDIHYWLLQWGTNDAMQMVAPDTYRANLQILIDKVKHAGHVPVLAHQPYVNLPGDRGTSVNQEIEKFNTVIDELTVTNKLIAGPDFYQLFRTHASAYLGPDGIHPSPAGAIAMNKAWFDVLRSHI